MVEAHGKGNTNKLSTRKITDLFARLKSSASDHNANSSFWNC